MIKNKTFWIGLGVGILSGLINYGLLQTNVSPYVAIYFAGIPFGILTGIYFSYGLLKKNAWFRTLLWIIVSGASYLSASLFLWGDNGSENYLLAGLIGVSILVIGYYFIYSSIPFWCLISILAIGAIIPFVIFDVFNLSDPFGNDTFGFGLLYIVWQGTITSLLTLGYLYRNENNV